MVKNLPGMQETLGWEDPLEKGMVTQYSIIAWRVLRPEKPGRLWSIGSHQVGHNWSDFARMCTEG